MVASDANRLFQILFYKNCCVLWQKDLFYFKGFKHIPTMNKKLNMTTKTWLSWSGCWHLNKWMHPFHSCCSFPSLCLPLIVPLSPPPLILTFIWAWLAKAQRNTSAFPFKWCYLLSSVWAPPYRSLLPPFPPSPTSSHAQPSVYFPCHLVNFMFRPASSFHLFFSHFHFITCPWL